MCLLYDGNSRRLNLKWFYGEAGNRTCDPLFTRHSTYPLHHGASAFSLGKKQLFLAFPWVETSTGPGGFMICVLVLLREHPKAHRKWFYGEAGNRTCDPCFTRHSAYPLHHCGFSTWGYCRKFICDASYPKS